MSQRVYVLAWARKPVTIDGNEIPPHSLFYARADHPTSPPPEAAELALYGGDPERPVIALWRSSLEDAPIVLLCQRSFQMDYRRSAPREDLATVYTTEPYGPRQTGTPDVYGTLPGDDNPENRVCLWPLILKEHMGSFDRASLKRAWKR